MSAFALAATGGTLLVWWLGLRALCFAIRWGQQVEQKVAGPTASWPAGAQAETKIFGFTTTTSGAKQAVATRLVSLNLDSTAAVAFLVSELFVVFGWYQKFEACVYLAEGEGGEHQTSVLDDYADCFLTDCADFASAVFTFIGILMWYAASALAEPLVLDIEDEDEGVGEEARFGGAGDYSTSTLAGTMRAELSPTNQQAVLVGGPRSRVSAIAEEGAASDDVFGRDELFDSINKAQKHRHSEPSDPYLQSWESQTHAGPPQASIHRRSVVTIGYAHSRAMRFAARRTMDSRSLPKLFGASPAGGTWGGGSAPGSLLERNRHQLGNTTLAPPGGAATVRARASEQGTAAASAVVLQGVRERAATSSRPPLVGEPDREVAVPVPSGAEGAPTGTPSSTKMEFHYSYANELDALRYARRSVIYSPHPEVARFLREEVSWRFIKILPPRARELYKSSRAAAKHMRPEMMFKGPEEEKWEGLEVLPDNFSRQLGPLSRTCLRQNLRKMFIATKRTKKFDVKDFPPDPQLICSEVKSVENLRVEIKRNLCSAVLIQDDKQKNTGIIHEKRKCATTRRRFGGFSRAKYKWKSGMEWDQKAKGWFDNFPSVLPGGCWQQ
eukprot:g13093.t1